MSKLRKILRGLKLALDIFHELDNAGGSIVVKHNLAAQGPTAGLLRGLLKAYGLIETDSTNPSAS